MAIALVDLKRLRLPAEIPQKIKPVKTPAQMGGGSHRAPPEAEKLLAISDKDWGKIIFL